MLVCCRFSVHLAFKLQSLTCGNEEVTTFSMKLYENKIIESKIRVHGSLIEMRIRSSFYYLPLHDSLLHTVNDRLSAAALIKVSMYLGAALIRLRRLFDCGAY